MYIRRKQLLIRWNSHVVKSFKIRIRFWSQLLEQRQDSGISRTPVREKLCEVFQTAALCVFAHRRVCRFQLVQAVVFLREAEQGIVKMTEFMQCRAGLGNVDAVLAEDSRANAVDAELPTEVRCIIAVDDICPTVFVERIEDRLRHFSDFQQEFVRIALHPVFYRDRRIGRRDGQAPSQDGMKKLRSFGACDEFRCSLVLSTKPNLLAEPNQ